MTYSIFCFRTPCSCIVDCRCFQDFDYFFLNFWCNTSVMFFNSCNCTTNLTFSLKKHPSYVNEYLILWTIQKNFYKNNNKFSFNNISGWISWTKNCQQRWCRISVGGNYFPSKIVDFVQSMWIAVKRKFWKVENQPSFFR